MIHQVIIWPSPEVSGYQDSASGYFSRTLFSCSHIQHGGSPLREDSDETRNAELNGNRHPEWWADFSKLQIQILQKSHFEFVPRDTSEFKSNQNLNSTLYREIPSYFIFSILTS